MPAVELLGLGRHGEPTDKERQPFQLIPGQVREVKDVTVDVDPNEERGDLEALDGAWRRERALDGGNRMGPAGRTDLDAAGAEIDTRRLPFAAAGVANPQGARHPRTRGSTPVAGVSRHLDLSGGPLRLGGLQGPHTGISTARGIPEASGSIRRNIRSLPRRCERQKVEISVAFEWARYARDGGRPVSFLPLDKKGRGPLPASLAGAVVIGDLLRYARRALTPGM